MQEAADLQHDTLTHERASLGEDHPVTLATANGLAVTLRAQGKIDEAEQLQRDILERRTRTLGPKHPDTLTSANNLGVALSSAGKFDEAATINDNRSRSHSGIQICYEMDVGSGLVFSKCPSTGSISRKNAK